MELNAGVCPYCGQRQATVAASSPIPWNMLGGVAIVLVALVVAGSGWTSANRAQTDAKGATLATDEPTNAIMSEEEARRETTRIRQRLVDQLTQWDGMADFSHARMKPNGVLELKAWVKQDDPGRRMASFVSGHVQSAVGGRFKVRGLAINASNGNRLMYRAWSEPIKSGR
jgi:hypothetical protein